MPLSVADAGSHPLDYRRRAKAIVLRYLAIELVAIYVSAYALDDDASPREVPTPRHRLRRRRDDATPTAPEPARGQKESHT